VRRTEILSDLVGRRIDMNSPPAALANGWDGLPVFPKRAFGKRGTICSVYLRDSIPHYTVELDGDTELLETTGGHFAVIPL